MLTSFISYFVTLVTFVAIDMAWLGTMASRFYKPMLGDIAIAGVNLPPEWLSIRSIPLASLSLRSSLPCGLARR